MMQTGILSYLIPILGVVVLIILIVLGIQLMGIFCRLKRILERVDMVSDVTSWYGMVRHVFKKKRSSQ